MGVSARDPVLRQYRVLLAFGIVAVLILLAGLLEFIYFEPFGQSGGPSVRIVGIFRYDPHTHKTIGADQRTFSRADSFAAVVDWSALPDSITVQAVWFDSFENVVGAVGPAKPSALAFEPTVPAVVPAGLKYHLPGQYIFAVERVNAGQPVQVLGRRIVLVER